MIAIIKRVDWVWIIFLKYINDINFDWDILRCVLILKYAIFIDIDAREFNEYWNN